MHTKARCRVDLDYPPARFAQRFADIGGDDVNARNIKADDPRDPLKQENIFRVHLIRQIDRCSAGRDICRGLQKYALAFFWNAVQLIRRSEEHTSEFQSKS